MCRPARRLGPEPDPGAVYLRTVSEGSGKLVDLNPGWPDAGVASGVGGYQRIPAIPGAQKGVGIELLAAQCPDGASAGGVEGVDDGYRQVEQHIEHRVVLVG
jgi:hypothetical protein